MKIFLDSANVNEPFLVAQLMIEIERIRPIERQQFRLMMPRHVRDA